MSLEFQEEIAFVMDDSLQEVLCFCSMVSMIRNLNK